MHRCSHHFLSSRSPLYFTLKREPRERRFPCQAWGREEGETWADLGAGAGTFSLALSELLGPTGTVIAVDWDHRALRRIGTPPASWALIRTHHADFTQPLKLTNLDGLLLANVLHFVARQEKVLRQLIAYLRPGGRVLFLEYDTEQVSP
jgi:ubiquinone/menaquinone biosynthesis C-methylase UbiE